MKPTVLITTVCLIVFSGHASGESISIPVTEAHKRLVVALWEGDIVVSPGDESALQIDAECIPQAPEAAEVASGFRSLRINAELPGIVSSDEVITIRSYEDDAQCSVTLTVPRQLELHTRTNFAGSISVDGWRGPLLAWSADGDVSVANYSGRLSATAMNGDANVSLAGAGIDADSAITAANGTLTLTVNADNVPALRAQARWGDVQTNLDTSFEQVVENGGTWFATGRNADAPVLTMRNLNRDIIIQSYSP